jgi:hypothetical protein
LFLDKLRRKNMKKSFVLIMIIAALFAALFLPGCDNGTDDKNTGGNNNTPASATLTWSGNWTKVSDTTYRSNAIGDSTNTIERLDIQATGAGTVTIQITASSESGYDYGYVSKLDMGVSTSDYQMRVNGTQVATYTYNIPAGSHWIQFMYQKDSYGSSGNDCVTVEIVSNSFTASGAAGNSKLKVQNQSSVTLTDVKWGSTVVSASLTPSELKTIDVAEGSGYLYFTKGSANGLKCRTQDVIAVTKDETKELTLTNNPIVVALDDTNNPQALGTIGAGESIAPSLTWTGSWTRVSDTSYRSNTIGNSTNTIERLNIAASSACTVTIQITASCSDYYYSYTRPGDYGYVSKLDTGVSTSGYQMRVTGTGVATYTYNIPSGSHWIQFMYQKDGSGSSGSDCVTVEVISINY